MNVQELSPRERRHQRTHEAILEAARQIINQDGPDALSMRAIARAIDYSPAGLYEYFGGKDEIICEVANQGHVRLKAAMQRVDPTLPVDQYLTEIGLAYIDFAVANTDYFLLMFTNLPEPYLPDKQPTELLEQMQTDESSFPILLHAIQRGLDEGIFMGGPDYGVLEMAYTAWATVHGIAMLRSTYGRDLPLDYKLVDREALRRLGKGLMDG
jgi:AcrR family transcriptional regulator